MLLVSDCGSVTGVTGVFYNKTDISIISPYLLLTCIILFLSDFFGIWF